MQKLGNEQVESYATIGWKALFRNQVISPVDAKTFRALDNQYAVDAERAYYNWRHISWWPDVNSLESLGHGFAKDRQRAYFKGCLLWGYAPDMPRSDPGPIPDIETLQAVSDGYAKDGRNVYQVDTRWYSANALCSLILGADPNTFVLLGDDYSKDEHRVYWNATLFEEADASTFITLGNGYAKDIRQAYFLKKWKGGTLTCKSIPWSDPATFEIINEQYSKDALAAYVDGEYILHSEGKTFEILSGNYAKDANSIYRCIEKYDGNNVYVCEQIEGADVATFTVLDDAYAKDDNYAYFKWDRLPNSNGKTFDILWNWYAKDAHQAYYHDGFHCYSIERANPTTFEVLDRKHAKDSRYIYEEWRYLHGSRWDTFVSLGFGYAKDSDYLYALNDGCWKIYSKSSYPYEKFISWLDLSTLKILSRSYAKDKNRAYHIVTAGYWSEINGANSETFEAIGENYAQDKSSVYMDGWPVYWADVGSFEVLGKDYARDRHSAYFKSSRIQWSDPISFTVLDEHHYAKDFNRAYYESKAIEWSDGASFELLVHPYSKDSHSAYIKKSYPEKIETYIEKVDWASFEILGNGYERDRFQVFLRGKLIENADSESFEIMDGGFARDEKSLYLNWLLCPGSDPKSFKILNDKFAVDNIRAYRYIEWGMSIPINPSNGGTFELIDNGYAKDLSRLYYRNDGKIILNGIDGETFIFLQDGYAKDARGAYWISDDNSMVLERVDAMTFETLWTGYAKDRNQAYYHGKTIIGANAQSFEVLRSWYARDRYRAYKLGENIPWMHPNAVGELILAESSALKEEIKGIFGADFEEDELGPEDFHQLNDEKSMDIIKTLLWLKKELDEYLIWAHLNAVVTQRYLYVFWETLSKDSSAVWWKEKQYASDIEKKVNYQIPIEKVRACLPILRT